MWRTVVYPDSSRCRTAARAPRYWSIATRRGWGRLVVAAATMGTSISIACTAASTSTSTTMSTMASTRCFRSPSIAARTAATSFWGELIASTL